MNVSVFFQTRRGSDQTRAGQILSPLKLDVHFIVCGLAGAETRRQSVLAQLIFPWLSFRDDNWNILYGELLKCNQMDKLQWIWLKILLMTLSFVMKAIMKVRPMQ